MFIEQGALGTASSLGELNLGTLSFQHKCSACGICRTLLYFNLTAAVGPPRVYHKSLRTHIHIEHQTSSACSSKAWSSSHPGCPRRTERWRGANVQQWRTLSIHRRGAMAKPQHSQLRRALSFARAFSKPSRCRTGHAHARRGITRMRSSACVCAQQSTRMAFSSFSPAS